MKTSVGFGRFSGNKLDKQKKRNVGLRSETTEQDRPTKPTFGFRFTTPDTAVEELIYIQGTRYRVYRCCAWLTTARKIHRWYKKSSTAVADVFDDVRQ